MLGLASVFRITPARRQELTRTFPRPEQNAYVINFRVPSSVGALAELFDISCISFDDPLFENIQTAAYQVWNATQGISILDVEKALGSGYPVLGQHYFIVNPFTGNGLSPVFDFRDGLLHGDSTAFIVTNKTGDLAAPTGKQDVDWLELATVQGSVAKTTFRVDTRYGQPPASVRRYMNRMPFHI